MEATSLLDSGAEPALSQEGEAAQKLCRGWSRVELPRMEACCWSVLTPLPIHGSLTWLQILAVALILYYVTYPSQEPLEVEADPFARYSQRTSQVDVSAADAPAVQLWETLNPANKPLVHIRIEPPSIVQFAVKGAEVGGANSTGSNTSIPAWPRLISSEHRMLWRLFKIVLLPITCTAGVLYLLLMFLLKNAELLDAQHGRAHGANGQQSDWDDGSIAGGTAAGIKFATLPRAFATDIELMAVASDGGVCAAVSSDNVLAIWPPGGHPCTVVELGNARGAVSCVALDARGRHVCVGTSLGMVSLWHIDSALGVAVSAGTFVDPVRRGAVLDLGFIRHIDDTVSVITTYDSGCVAEWDTTTGDATMVRPSMSSDTIARTLLIHERDRDITGVAFILITGIIEVVDCLKGPGAWSSTSTIQIEPVHDTVVSLNRTRVAVQDGGSRLVLATLSRSGALRIWDGHTSEPMLHLDNIKLSTGEEDSALLQLAGMSPEMSACERCREQADGGFTLALGVGETVFVYRATIGDRCACALAGGSKLGGGRRSRSSSAAPPLLRTRGPQRALTSLDYPISGHGYHSRRSSEKESRRNLTVDDDLYQELNGELTAASTRWRDLTAYCVIDVACERGAWALMDGTRVVGVRRRARGTAGQGPFNLPVVGTSNALSAAVLQRWEAWSVDTSHLSPGSRSSTLYSLSMAANPSPAASTRPSRAGSRHSSISSLTTGTRSTVQSPQQLDVLSDGVYPRLPFTRASCLRAVKNQCFVGLGNTLGVVQLAPPTPRPLPPVSTRNSSPVISRRGSAGGLNVAFGALGHGLGPPLPSVL